MSDKEIYAYTAGLIDGEGWVGLLPVWKGNGYHAAVKVSSVDPYMTVFLHEHYGGHLAKPRILPYPQRPSVEWTLRNGKNVREFLEKIYPYLLVKRKQAEVVMEYVNSFDQHSLRNQIIWDKKREFYLEIRRLNKRGTAPAETK